MAELMVALSALGLIIIQRRHRSENWFIYDRHLLPSHTPCWFASTPPIRIIIEQLADNQSEYLMASYPPIANTLQTLQVESEQTPSGQWFVPKQRICTRTCPSLPDCFRYPMCVPAFTLQADSDTAEQQWLSVSAVMQQLLLRWEELYTSVLNIHLL